MFAHKLRTKISKWGECFSGLQPMKKNTSPGTVIEFEKAKYRKHLPNICQNTLNFSKVGKFLFKRNFPTSNFFRGKQTRETLVPLEKCVRSLCGNVNFSCFSFLHVLWPICFVFMKLTKKHQKTFVHGLWPNFIKFCYFYVFPWKKTRPTFLFRNLKLQQTSTMWFPYFSKNQLVWSQNMNK